MLASMAARGFMKPSAHCPSLLKKSSPDATVLKVARSQFLLHPKLFPSTSWHSLRIGSLFSCKRLPLPQENIMQRKNTMSFAVRASAEEEGEEKREPYRWLSPELKELTKEKRSINPFLLIAGIAILFFTWKAIVNELLYWLRLALRAFRPVLALVFACLETAAEVVCSLVDAALPLVAAVTTGTAWASLIVKEVYRFIIDMTPVKGLIEALVLASAVLGIGEATKRDAISSQPYTIGLAGLFGLGAVLGFLRPPIFVLFLLVSVAFSSLVMKRDAVSSVMPVAAVLAAVAEPWVRGIALASFLILAIYQNWKSPEKEQAALDSRTSHQGLPTLMYVLSLMVGISTAARWLYFRHLLWFAK